MQKRGERDNQEQIDDKRGQSSIHRDGYTTERKWVHRRLKILYDGHPGTDTHTHCPTNDESLAMKPARVETKEYSRERLQDPDASKQLKVNRKGIGKEKDESQCPNFDQQ